MRKTAIFIGIVAGILSILLWFALHFFNPYSNSSEFESIVRTFFMLFLPACLAIAASLTSKNFLMLIAFLWSFPISLYLVLTPGLFALFGATSIAYLISYMLMLIANNKKTVAER